MRTEHRISPAQCPECEHVASAYPDLLAELRFMARRYGPEDATDELNHRLADDHAGHPQ